MISVIVPLFDIRNRKNLFYGAIDSVLGQTYKDFEILMCFDGVVDKQDKKIVTEYINKKSDNRIALFKTKDEIKAGCAIIRNSLVSISSGNFLTFHDSDDFSNRCRFMKLMKEIGTDDLIASNIHVAYLNDMRRSKTKKYKGTTIDLLIEQKNPKAPIICASAIMTKDIFLDMGGFENYTYSSDSIFAIKIGYYRYYLKNKNIKVFDSDLYTWNRHSSSITMSGQSSSELQQCQLIQRKDIREVFIPKIESGDVYVGMQKEKLKEYLCVKDNFIFDVKLEKIL